MNYNDATALTNAIEKALSGMEPEYRQNSLPEARQLFELMSGAEVVTSPTDGHRYLTLSAHFTEVQLDLVKSIRRQLELQEFKNIALSGLMSLAQCC